MVPTARETKGAVREAVMWPGLTSGEVNWGEWGHGFQGSGDACKQVVTALQHCRGHPRASPHGQRLGHPGRAESQQNSSSSKTQGKPGNQGTESLGQAGGDSEEWAHRGRPSRHPSTRFKAAQGLLV